MIRVQMKDNDMLLSAILELLSLGYNINVTNKDGKCLYVWTGENKRCDVHHWTNDCPIMDIDTTHYKWFINCIKGK